MRNRLSWNQAGGDGGMAALESRALPSAGLVGLSGIVRDLGTVTAAAAARGVEATALISPQSSVTFRFSVQDASQYTLLVRHVGDGLTLDASTPAGVAAIDPGAAGPFRVVPLHLDAATYEITATARAGQPVFVDWELLLNGGVGQAVAVAPPAILPAIAIAIPNPAAGPGGAAPLAATPTPAAASTPAGGDCFGPAQGGNVPTFLVSGPRGWPTVEADAPPAVVASAPGSPPAASTGPALVELESALVLTMQPGATDPQGPADPGPSPATSWLTSLWGGVTDRPSGGADAGPAALEVVAARLMAEPQPDRAAPSPISLSAISPGLLLGAMTVTVAARSRIKGNPTPFGRTTSAGSPMASTPSTIGRLRAIFDRSYRPNRCRQVRPLEAQPGHRRSSPMR